MVLNPVFSHFTMKKSHITISTRIPLYCTVLQYCTAHFYLAVQPGVSSSGIQQGQEELGEKGRANDLSPPHGPWIHSVFHRVGLQVLCLAPGPKGRLRPGQSQGLLYKHLCCRTPDQTNKKTIDSKNRERLYNRLVGRHRRTWQPFRTWELFMLR